LTGLSINPSCTPVPRIPIVFSRFQVYGGGGYWQESQYRSSIGSMGTMYCSPAIETFSFMLLFLDKS
jgi:hypothetical protein